MSIRPPLVLLAALLALGLCPPRLEAGAAGGLMMGSVVKSEKWKMDRLRSLEIFEGKVSFLNAVYNLKADYAVYDRKARVWDLHGSVYCLRKFLDGAELELYCDSGKYMEDMQKAEVFRGTAPVLMKYMSGDGKPLNGRCDRIVADNARSSMDFLGNFYMQTPQTDIFSDNGFYSDTDHSFLIYNSAPDPAAARSSPKPGPLAVGRRDGRDFAMTGEKMKFFKDTGDVKLYNRVAGWIKAVKTAPDAAVAGGN